MSAETKNTPELIEALSEVFILREALKGAIVGDQIIARQFESADEPMYAWAHKQAAHNAACNRASLERSLADFPWNGSFIDPATTGARS